MRILSGVQPTGKLHLGNYFGAVRQHVELQKEVGADCFYFIADYHALTTIQDAATLREHSLDVTLTYLALGLDPERSVFYRQSDVPEVTELTWMLSAVSGMGLLERAHSYKDKTAKGIKPSVGLFVYPVLMASDILIVKSDIVPVGQDQQQHVEMAQDMATSFNAAFGREVLVRPECRLSATPKVPGTDGAKMSKSYNNIIEIFESGKALKKNVMGIKTSSVNMGDPLPTDGDTVLELYKLFASADELAEMEQDYRKGAIGYGDAKKRLLAKVDAYFAPARERREKLLADLSYVEDVLRDGARRAGEVTRATIDECREVTGFGRIR
ncbi:MAG: tryptophan--tRNA ligase [bacterium]|nr:tryptophan--tRNA ligase [bacterium]